MTSIRVDIETRSSVELKKRGVYSYSESPDFRVLMAAWSINGAPATIQEDPFQIRDTVEFHLSEGSILTAHNAQFERICFSRLLRMPVGTYLPPEQFHDTMAVAKEHGYPAGLDALAKALGTAPKDSAGTRLINLFCKPNRKGEFNRPEDFPKEWELFKLYCCRDVDTLVEVDELLGDFPTESERQVYFADQRVNDRGIQIDTDLAKVAMEAAAANRIAQTAEVVRLTGVANPGSQPQFLKWCRKEISEKINDLRAPTIQKLLDHPRLKPEHREILELRQELALVASKKFAGALGAVSADGRLRGTLSFFGAHTGRWSGKGTQPQNLPREAFTHEDPVTGKKVWDEAAEKMAILDLLLGSGASALDLKRLVRSMFVINGAVVDYASIEARVIAWLAGEEWALQAFRDGRDIYVETADRMGGEKAGMTRAHGKVAVLALGYQGGINSLKAMAGDASALSRIEMPPGVGPGEIHFPVMFRALNPDVPAKYLRRRDGNPVKTEQEVYDGMLRRIVDEWRLANPSIVQFWYDLQDAVEDGGQVGPYLRLTRDGETLRMHLPSGRAITYHGVRRERYRVQDPETGRWLNKAGWRYDDPKRAGHRIGTYGGRLAENATQAVARDLLAAALVRLDAAGYEVVAHVHDEAVAQNATDVEEMSKIMCDSPAWATGLPVDAEGDLVERYRKL